MRQERHRAWEEAAEQARVQFITDLNRRRLSQQLSDREQAARMRDYAADLELVGEISDQEALIGWVAWVRREADRVDPLLHPDMLKKLVPPEIRAPDLEPFMPKGMSAWRPPN